MAQLSGVMTADFSDFRKEVDTSVVKLQTFGQQANVLTGTFGRTTEAADDFTGGIRQVDQTLSALGVNISKPIRALEELSALANKNVASMGAGGLLGAMTATGVATYELTRFFIDLAKPVYDVDVAVSKLWASLLGLGDDAAQRTGARLDVLTRATQIAKREITSFDEAMEIIKEHNLGVAESFNTSASRVRRWGEDIAKVRASGDLPSITKELKEGTSTVKQLAEQYHISAEAITWYTNRAKESSAILDQWREKEKAALEKVRLAQEELNQAGGGWRETLASIAPVTATAVTQYLAMGASQTTLATAYGLSKFQVEALDKAYKEQTATIAGLEPAVQSLDTWIMTAGKQFAVAAESGDQFKTMLELTGDAASTLTPEIEKLDTTFRSLTTAMAMGTASKNAPGSVGVNTGGISFGSIGPEAALARYTATFGTSSAAGMIGGGPAPDFLTWAMKMGYAAKPVVNNTFNIVDTESNIANNVANTISSQIQRGSLVS